MSPIFWVIIVLIGGVTVWLFLRWNDRRNSVQFYTPQDESRDLSKLKRYFRREVVEAKVKLHFSKHDPAEILKLLDEFYPPPTLELERSQLDIIKLSDGDVDQLRHYIEVAESERFRDIANLAEYPESSKITDHKELFGPNHKQLIAKDLQQYLKWLKQQ